MSEMRLPSLCKSNFGSTKVNSNCGANATKSASAAARVAVALAVAQHPKGNQVADIAPSLLRQRHVLKNYLQEPETKVYANGEQDKIDENFNQQQTSCIISSHTNTHLNKTTANIGTGRGGKRRLIDMAKSNKQQPPNKIPKTTPNAYVDIEQFKQTATKYSWHWNELDKARDCHLDEGNTRVLFHPECAEGAAAIRGSRPFKRDGSIYYWEIKVLSKLFGTSTMFGVCTKKQRLSPKRGSEVPFCNIIGLDEEGWSLSHKGYVWHDGDFQNYTDPLPIENATIGVLLDTSRGELSFYVNGVYRGIAFNNLNDTDCDLYPVVGSTALNSKVKLLCSNKKFLSLHERASFTYLNYFGKENLEQLLEHATYNKLPNILIKYLAELCHDRKSEEDDNRNQIDHTRIWSHILQVRNRRGAYGLKSPSKLLGRL